MSLQCLVFFALWSAATVARIVRLYGLMVCALALSGFIAFARGRLDRGRLWLAKAALFAALPLMAFFSLNAMQAAWP